MGAIEDINNLTPKGKALLHKVTEPSQPTIKEQVTELAFRDDASNSEYLATQILTLITQHLLEGIDKNLENGTAQHLKIRAFVEGMLK